MLLVDTNVIVALFVHDSPRCEAARALHAHDDLWLTEGHALVELTSVMVRQIRIGELNSAQVEAVIREAHDRFEPMLVPVDPLRPIGLAIDHGVSAYDARFLAAAEQVGLELITEDVKLRRAAPTLTQSLEQALKA